MAAFEIIWFVTALILQTIISLEEAFSRVTRKTGINSVLPAVNSLKHKLPVRKKYSYTENFLIS